MILVVIFDLKQLTKKGAYEFMRTLFMGILYYFQKNNVMTTVIVENERGSYQVRCDNQLILTATEERFMHTRGLDGLLLGAIHKVRTN